MAICPLDYVEFFLNFFVLGMVLKSFSVQNGLGSSSGEHECAHKLSN